ncbi:MAG TPA: hypothetical protein VHX88_21060 [Solirubrobacteraceae bacterium]|jgi:hypothetical protein|nr:hypothetical protein [Solirubrobacteraceae bacterium]
MRIRTHIGVSLDGYVAGEHGRPAVLSLPDRQGARGHGFPDGSVELAYSLARR